jgi:hypothetical protein
MTTQYTPGPWEICPNWPEQNQRKIQPEGEVSGVALSFGDTDEEAEANARLIAAAPEMLEALKIAKHYMEGDSDDDIEQEDYAFLTGVIAKAT